ncbi:threonylcarbamoyl-AMP synthase [Alloacidobacterium dinghuense]|uniref:Threonylcarbamoyl-AMP synthase n=1 Tax=Alloacidobacterium dinghuense TaxID=2763107 RepID=A0A7G8BPA5_9BACT|nr:L-threonylcarbamoyladenylate synthase [Alloacidobacterium dinghuense]QNI34375.1 threonylcarbamoyl-AMP synthase [Alloacidobacterium dinghuense]
MPTLRLSVDPHHLSSEASRSSLKRAAEILRSGGTVAIPTETVYGLGANALDANAIAKIFAAKERPSWDPLIVHISDASMLHRVVASVPESAAKLIDTFWPGPLTLLMPKGDAIQDAVTACRPRVGVRMPQHPVAQALIREAGVPIAAPSANRFGRTSPTTAEHVAEDLDGRIDAILDSGETTHGLESTVIDVCENPCVIYRPGVISLEQIRAAGVDAIMHREIPGRNAAEPASLPSPGVGLRHYAPRAKLMLVDGGGEEQIEAFRAALTQAQQNGARLGLMLPDEFQPAVKAIDAIIYRWGKWSDAEELAQRLFAGLRFLDNAGASVIVCPLPASAGISVAIRDRLSKAAKTEKG